MISFSHASMPSPIGRPKRLLVVLPSWLGDVVMATPALRRLRNALPGSYIAGLARPGPAGLLKDHPCLDEIIIERAGGVMGPKRAAAKVRPLRFDAALLLTNSFSTALITRLAGIPIRLGYNRDGRGPFLTHKLHAPQWPGSTMSKRRWAPIPAVVYYDAAAQALLGHPVPDLGSLDDPMSILAPDARLELPLLESDRRAAREVLEGAGLDMDVSTLHGDRGGVCLLNPGANNPSKRWPADRFGQLASILSQRWGMRILISTGPGEEALADEVARHCKPGVEPVLLAKHGHSLASLKGLLAISRLLITNDTGPRHMAAALGTPTVALFGPTDWRWTQLPETGSDQPREIRLCAGFDTLGPFQLADEHPDRCAIDRIELEEVLDAAGRLLASPTGDVSSS